MLCPSRSLIAVEAVEVEEGHCHRTLRLTESTIGPQPDDGGTRVPRPVFEGAQHAAPNTETRTLGETTSV